MICDCDRIYFVILERWLPPQCGSPPVGQTQFCLLTLASALGLRWNPSVAFIVIMVEGALLQAELEFCKHMLEHALEILKRGFQ